MASIEPSQQRRALSVLIPFYNEEGNIQPLVDEVQSLIDRPSGATARKVAAVFSQQPLFVAATGFFGRGATLNVGMSTLMAEAFTISQLPAPLRKAREAAWQLRESLFQVL